MEKYEQLDVATADLAYRAYGKSLSELFENAALGLSDLLCDTSRVEPKVVEKISINAADFEALLHDFLQELLFLFSTKHLLFSCFRVKIRNHELEAEVSGEKLDPEKHELRGEIKAVTYHLLKIRKKGGIYATTIVCDT